MNILTINAGSSSIKYKVYTQGKLLLSGLIEGITEVVGQWHHQYQDKKRITRQFADHQQAFSVLAEQLYQDLADYPIQGVGHRVVHGGEQFYQPTVITDHVLEQLKKLSSLAPLHNPVNILGIEYARQHFPAATHVAVFDSGFHHTMPEHVRRYAINTAIADQYQIRRYGFHGINHQYVAIQAAKFLNKPLEKCNFITLHLGNGASACLIKQGQSQDTSMGMTPLAGLVMGTRCGDIDPAIPLYLLAQGLPGQEIDQLLNKKSGLKGVGNDNDMRNILKLISEGNNDARLALKMYVYAIQKVIGAYFAQTDSLDALIFTGGVGENAAAVRQEVIAPLRHLNFQLNEKINQSPADESCQSIASGAIPILIIKGDEEIFIAQQVEIILQP
ncbi:acetate/propionate family kinase [Legionella dresdenensis]|uniref:Acetate kinase n=1 Tax=Legionella dresdenensis TaxID=450200 RepID=A0ABV8CB93_9GAMM